MKITKKLVLYLFLLLFIITGVSASFMSTITYPTSATPYGYSSCTSLSCTSPVACASGSCSITHTGGSYTGLYLYESGKRVYSGLYPAGPYSISSLELFKTTDLSTGSCTINPQASITLPATGLVGNTIIIPTISLTSTLKKYPVSLPSALYSRHNMLAHVEIEVINSTGHVVANLYDHNLNFIAGDNTNNPSQYPTGLTWTPTVAGEYRLRVSTYADIEPKCSGKVLNPSPVYSTQITITSPISYTWDVSSWSMCTPTGTSCSLSLNSVPGEQTRTAICTDSIGTPVSNSFCISAGLPMPQTNQPCTQVCDVDSDTVGNLDDWCKTQSWEELGHTATSPSQFQGCPYEYTLDGFCHDDGVIACGFMWLGSCDPSVSFNPVSSAITCNDDGMFGDSYFAKSITNTCVNGDWQNDPNCGNLAIKILSGTGRYVCANEETGNHYIIGYCDLRHNLNPTLTCNIMQGLTPLFSVPMSTSLKVYKYGSMLPGEFSDPLYYESVTCSGTSYTLTMSVSYSSPRNLSGIEYLNVIRNPQGNLVENDSTTNGKISCSSENLTCYINTTQSGLQEINLSGIENTSNYIKIIKNGINIRNDTVDILSLALQAHKIESFKNTSEAEHFIEKSYDIMTKFNITKNLTYNSFTGKTKVEISMAGIPSSDRQNLTLYIIVPKQVATSLSSITNIQEGNGQFFVKDKDPIIGWYFNESEDNETVSVEVPGETEGGSILITQTPILYNEGELIINYREDSCNLGELELFELEDLIDSKVYSPGSAKLYKVCITHLNPAVILNFGSAPLSVDVMSYDDGQNASQDTNQLSNKIILNSNDNNLYWDVKVQKTNPSGNYSCIGSFDIQNSSSLFGDCGYKENNRLWIHLGADYNPPITTVSYPYLSHTMKVILTAFEPSWESGVKQITYRIVEDNLTFTTVLSNTTEFFVTCQNDWGCKKTIEYYAEDNAGNIETLKTRELPLIDKGSACQADCSARPAPNRYLKECRNLNGCEYFTAPWELGENKGEHVANACDYLTIGSWGRYNLTHDILCPSGPFIESRFTNQLVDLLSESDCENLVKTPYPIIIDGEQSILNIVSCINEK